LEVTIYSPIEVLASDQSGAKFGGFKYVPGTAPRIAPNRGGADVEVKINIYGRHG
jgi:hypothetical protein